MDRRVALSRLDGRSLRDSPIPGSAKLRLQIKKLVVKGAFAPLFLFLGMCISCDTVVRRISCVKIQNPRVIMEVRSARAGMRPACAIS